jgi:ribosomal-protein-alanine N-acetyltransferase
MATIFETARLVVRPYTEDDKEIFFSLNGNADVVRYIRPVKTKEECNKFLLEIIAAANATPLYGRWAVHEKTSGDFVGSFAIIPVDDSNNIQMGYALLPQHWGKGYATELTKEGLQYVFAKTPLPTIYGYTEKPNTASQKVLLKCGFQHVSDKIEAGREIVGFVLSKKDHAMSNSLQKEAVSE